MDSDEAGLVADVTFACLFVALVFCLVMGLFARPAKAHEWYDFDCCAMNDCAALEPAAVQESPVGFVVTIRPGSHPMWPAAKPHPLVVVYPYRSSKVRPSRDEHWHVCINATGAPLCLYVIGGGF